MNFVDSMKQDDWDKFVKAMEEEVADRVKQNY
jgi:hypothetical protein